MNYYQKKLNHFQVYEIVGRLLKGEMFVDIAKDYGVCKETIFSIYEKRTWQYMTKKLTFDKHDERRKKQAESLRSKDIMEPNLECSKLTKTQLLEIISRLQNGESHKSISKDYDYSAFSIKKIATKRVFSQYTKDISFDKYWENSKKQWRNK